MNPDHLIWKNTNRVRGVFSLKNPSFGSENRIPGLNLGYNTSDSDDITKRNRELWLNAMGTDPVKTAWGIQVHQNRVQTVDKPGVYDETDGLVSRTQGLNLGIFVADCAAVLLADETNGVIGACHAGWKGAVSGIIENTVDAMSLLGADPGKTEAFVSPCISLRNFEVGEEVASQFPETFVSRDFAKPHVDLKGFVVHTLASCGLKNLHIKSEEGCTMEEPNLYYSYRREKELSGRMMALIGLKA